MASSTVALYVHDPSCVHLDFAPQVSFDCESQCVDLVPDSCELLFGEVAHSYAWRDAELLRDSISAVPPDAVDGGQSDLDSEIVSDVYACDDCQCATS